jgi:hypothetical protein
MCIKDLSDASSVTLIQQVRDAVQLVHLHGGLAGVALLALAKALLFGLTPDLLGLLQVTMRNMGFHTF